MIWRKDAFFTYLFFFQNGKRLSQGPHNSARRFNWGLQHAEWLLLLYQLTQDKCHQCVCVCVRNCSKAWERSQEHNELTAWIIIINMPVCGFAASGQKRKSCQWGLDASVISSHQRSHFLVPLCGANHPWHTSPRWKALKALKFGTHGVLLLGNVGIAQGKRFLVLKCA